MVRHMLQCTSRSPHLVGLVAEEGVNGGLVREEALEEGKRVGRQRVHRAILGFVGFRVYCLGFWGEKGGEGGWSVTCYSAQAAAPTSLAWSLKRVSMVASYAKRRLRKESM